MIVSIQNPTVQSSAQSVAQSMAPPSFESMLPLLKMKFRKATINFDSWDARDEAIQELTAMAFILFNRLLRQGKHEKIYATPLAQYAIHHYFNGRRVTGTSSTDALSPRTQLLGRATVVNAITDSCICKRTFRPSTIGTFNLDFDSWLKTLADKKRDILLAVLQGESTSEIADNFGVTRGRISQIRVELAESWKAFVATPPKKRDSEMKTE